MEHAVKKVIANAGKIRAKADILNRLFFCLFILPPCLFHFLRYSGAIAVPRNSDRVHYETYRNLLGLNQLRMGDGEIFYYGQKVQLIPSTDMGSIQQFLSSERI